MFTVELHETELYINTFRVVDLRKPFHRILHDKESVERLLRTPSESLSRQKKPLTYYVKFAERKAGAMFNSEVAGLRCHWIYNTNTSVSPLFRDKALLTMLSVLDQQEVEIYAEVRRYLSSILRLLCKSFAFDCVVTSLHVVPMLIPDFPVIVLPLKLTSLPKQVARPSARYTTLQAVLKGHPEGIPLSLLTGSSYNFLSLRHTSFDRDVLKDKKNILIIEGTNTSYSGFLAREFAFLGVREVLPTTIYHIGT